ncbi:MAG: GntR family transcriptional regulator [Xanthomonadales bacterium]|nr:GntR family transcriptional regulator [Xanthomonadales bacterium]
MVPAATTPTSLAEQAFDVLEQKLVTLALPPGQQVSEGELIKMTGFGRTPVREAIQRLAQQELFVVLPRKGLVVTPVDRAGMVYVLEARKPIERVIVHRAALNARDDQRSEISAIARKFTFMHDDFEGFLKLDSQLDRLIDECSGNHYATAAAAPLRSHCRRFWYFHRHQIPLADPISAHSKMARLVARRDYIGAQKASDLMIGIMERFAATFAH